jgi:hypothetical protein
MNESERSLYETETMAELCARQGRLQEAVAIYRRLLDGDADADAGGGAPQAERPAGPDAGSRARNQARWQDRLETLERAWGHAAGEEIDPEPIPVPRAPGVSVLCTEDSVTVAWATAPDGPAPLLELFLVQRTPTGVEASKRRMLLPDTSGRIAFAVPALHTALAAVGHDLAPGTGAQGRGEAGGEGDASEDARFVPVARSPRR